MRSFVNTTHSLVSSTPLELIEALRERLEMTQLTDAEYWRIFAKQARTEALKEKPRRPRETMLMLARTYDQLADAAEKKKPRGA
jgi:hypothetical protein